MQEIHMLDLGPLTKAEKERRTKKKLTRHFPALAMVGWVPLNKSFWGRFGMISG